MFSKWQNSLRQIKSNEYKKLTLGCGKPVFEFWKAGISLEARSDAISNNSPSYQSGSNSPKGCFLSCINKWADKSAPSILNELINSKDKITMLQWKYKQI